MENSSTFFTLCANKNIAWKTLLIRAFTFIILLAIFTFYFQGSSLVPLWISILISITIATGTTLGTHFSANFRCAILTSFLMCFSSSGLFLFYTIVALLTISDVLTEYLKGLLQMGKQLSCVGKQIDLNYMDSGLGDHYEKVHTFFSIIHFFVFFPLVFVLANAVYSLYRQSSLESQKEISRGKGEDVDEEVEENRNLRKMLQKIHKSVSTNMTFMVGCLFGFTFAIIYCNATFAWLPKLDEQTEKILCSRINIKSTSFFITSFLGSASVIWVLSLPFFSNLVKKYKAMIIFMIHGIDQTTNDTNTQINTIQNP